VYVCMYKCIHDYKCASIVYAWVYAWLCVCMYILVYICIGVCTCAFMCTCGYMCLVICYSNVNLFVRSEPSNRWPRPDLDLYSLWIRYASDSKIDPWDVPEIRTGSCSGDQTVIRFQNRVISCECLFIGLFQFQCFILIFHAHVYIILHYSVHAGNYYYIVMLWYYFIDISLLCYQQYCRFVLLF